MAGECLHDAFRFRDPLVPCGREEIEAEMDAAVRLRPYPGQAGHETTAWEMQAAAVDVRRGLAMCGVMTSYFDIREGAIDSADGAAAHRPDENVCRTAAGRQGMKPCDVRGSANGCGLDGQQRPNEGGGGRSLP